MVPHPTVNQNEDFRSSSGLMGEVKREVQSHENIPARLGLGRRFTATWNSLLPTIEVGVL
jgi:hypothetical protein